MESSSSSFNYEETVERPVYGYLLHNDEQRLEILEKCPNISARKLSITIANSWKSFSEEEKNEYAERAKELNWKCLSEDEKNAHLEHVKELASKLKETHCESSELNDDRPTKKSKYNNEIESDSDEQESDDDDDDLSDDCNDYTQDSYQYDSNTNSSINLPEQPINLSEQSINLPERSINLPEQSINLPEQPSPALTNYIMDNTSKMLQFYPETNVESIKQVLLDNWNCMSPEQRTPWESIIEQDQSQNNGSFISNASSDYDFDDLLNTEEDSEVDESNQCYLRELIHTYNNHKRSRESWTQSSKEDESSVENEELIPVNTPRCRSEVVFQKDLSISKEIVPEHCSLLDTQLDVQLSPDENIFTDTYENSTLTDKQVFSKQHNKPLEIQFLIKPYNKENENVYVSSSYENKGDPKLTTPLQPRNMNIMNQNEPISHKSRNVQQFQQDQRYGLKVPVPCITACEHYQKTAKLNDKNKYSSQIEFNKNINDRWTQMVFTEKKRWEDMEKSDKERYEKEREEYLTSQHDCFLRSQEGIPLNDWL